MERYQVKFVYHFPHEPRAASSLLTVTAVGPADALHTVLHTWPTLARFVIALHIQKKSGLSEPPEGEGEEANDEDL
jgi:hypothetical protein